MALPVAEWLELDDPWHPFQPKPIYDSVISLSAQKGCGCPVPGGVQGQVGWGPGQHGLVNGEVSGPARQGGCRFMILEVPSNPGHSVILVASAYFLL